MSVLVSTVHVWANIRDNPTAFCRADFIGANAQCVSSIVLDRYTF